MSARLLLAAAWLKPVPKGLGAQAARAGGEGRLDLAPTRSGSRRFRDRAGAAGPPDVSTVVRRVPILTLGACAVVALAALWLTPVQAQTVQAPASTARVGGPPGPCVQVDVAGHRAGHLDCAAEALREAARSAQIQARSGIDTPVPQAGSPDVTVGVSSLSGSRLRMGNALGVSVHPQRPGRSFSAPRSAASSPAAPPSGGRP